MDYNRHFQHSSNRQGRFDYLHLCLVGVERLAACGRLVTKNKTHSRRCVCRFLVTPGTVLKPITVSSIASNSSAPWTSYTKACRRNGSWSSSCASSRPCSDFRCRSASPRWWNTASDTRKTTHSWTASRSRATIRSVRRRSVRCCSGGTVRAVADCHVVFMSVPVLMLTQRRASSMTAVFADLKSTQPGKHVIFIVSNVVRRRTYCECFGASILWPTVFQRNVCIHRNINKCHSCVIYLSISWCLCLCVVSVCCYVSVHQTELFTFYICTHVVL